MGESGSSTIPLLFWLSVAAALIWWAIHQGRSGAVSAVTARSPREVTLMAIHTFSTRGWTTTTQATDSATFTRTQTPGCLMTLFLFLFGIVPGLIYLMAAKRTLTVSVSAHPLPGPNGTSEVIISWSRNGGGKRPGLAFKDLVAPGATLREGAPAITRAVSSRVKDFGGRMASAYEPKRTSTVTSTGMGMEIQERASGSVVPTPPADLGGFCNTCGFPRSQGAVYCGKCGLRL